MGSYPRRGGGTLGGVQPGACHRMRALAAVSGVDTGSPAQQLVGLTMITVPSLGGGGVRTTQIVHTDHQD